MSLSIQSTATVQPSSQVNLYQDVRKFQLENGLTVLIKPSRKAATVAMHLAVKSGSADEGVNLGSGLSHLVEHMFFKGTPTRPTGHIEAAVRRMGGVTNAYTSHDSTVYFLKVLSSHFDEALSLMADATFHSNFPEAEFEKEREVVFGEFRMNADRLGRVVYMELWKLVYQQHPYGHPVIGYRPLFEAITRQDLIDFHRQHYVPNNMVLAIVGDVDVEHAEQHVRATFGPESMQSYFRTPRPAERQQISSRSTTIFRKAQHARYLIGFPTVPFSHPDAVPLDILSAILGQSSASRLNQVVKEEKQLVLGIHSVNSTIRDHGIFIVISRLDPEKLPAVKQAIQSEIRQLQTDGIRVEELERIKQQALASFYQGLETHEAVSHDIVLNQAFVGDYRYSQEYVKAVQALSVADIQRVAHYLDVNRMNEVTLLPERLRPEAVGDLSKVQAHNIEKIELSNGLSVLLEEDASTPTIAVSLVSKGGLRYETAQNNGIYQVMSTLATKGTTEHTRLEITELIENWGGSLSSFSGQHSFGFTMSALSKHSGDALNLLYEILTQADMPEVELEKVRRLQIEALKAKRENVYDIAGLLMNETLYGNHVYALDARGSEETLTRMSRQDLLDLWSKAIDPRETVLAISGDINKDELRITLEQNFGALKTASVSAPSEPPSVVEQARFAEESTEREQAVVMLGFQGSTIFDDDRFAYSVLNAVMSGSAGRLYQNIRADKGLSYVVSAGLSIGADTGRFVCYAAVDREDVRETRRLLSEEIKKLSKGITEAELADAKVKLIGDFQRSIESKFGRINQLAAVELYKDWQVFFDFEKNIAEVTRNDVQAVIKKYVNLDRATQVVVRPSPEEV